MSDMSDQDLIQHFASREELRRWPATGHPVTSPSVVLLSGNLGAGKTQMVRWICEAWRRDTASPTFAIHHEYRSAEGTLDHVDLYRVKSDDDLEGSGFWDLLQNDRAMLFVEWAERLPEDVWPRTWTKVFIQLKKEEGADEARILSMKIRKR
ncbi:MAG: tRNA (adenosine(37)-N6)-threonylcarbamoyltransferase complex ATPase subunit type 1 TsaE [Bdellovibrionaceae bacterium]|nr:tRNA (adenosine(37)-N6)-threonylcarbamoyltransferase complex ATPase subunit type 1 TsaE [Pseudobdellovibrionaceae bacterium]